MKIFLRTISSRALVLCALIIVGVGLSHSPALAQGSAGQPGEFLRFGVGARALGMGRAYTALADNANAIYWNPAGLYNVIREGVSFSVMYAKLFEATRYNFAAVAIPLELFFPAAAGSPGAEMRHWDVGLGYLFMGSGGYEVRTQENRPTGETFSDQQSAFYFTLTRSLAVGEEQFGVGLSVKMLSHNLFGMRSRATAVDLGIKYQPHWDWLTIGIVAQNFNAPDFGFGAGTDIIPRSLRAGAAFHLRTGRNQIDALTLAADVFLLAPGKRAREWFLGGEYDFLRAFGLPIRLRLGFNSTNRLTFGFNLDLPNNTLIGGGNQMLPRLDWAYLSDGGSSLGALTQQFSMEFSYTPFTSQRWYDRGMQKFEEGRFDLAREDFRRAAIAKNPNHTLFPQYALLRLGDIQLKTKRDKKVGLRAAMGFYGQAFLVLLEKKDEFMKSDQNLESLLYFVQGLIDGGREEEALRVLDNSSSWYADAPQEESFGFLKAWANLKLHRTDEAENVLGQLSQCGSCQFLKGLIAIRKGEFGKAYNIFGHLIQTQGARIADDLIILPFSDHLLLDDAYFLRTYAKAQMEQANASGAKPESIAPELADIQRFFPLSDVLDLMKLEKLYGPFLNPENASMISDLERFWGRYWQYLGLGPGQS